MANVGHTGCPDAFTIASYVAAILPEDARFALETHFGECTECLDRLASISRGGLAAPSEVEAAALDRAWRRVEQGLAESLAGQEVQATSAPEPQAGRVISLRASVRTPLRRCDPKALAAATEVVPPLSAITLLGEGVALMAKLGRDERSGDLVVYLLTEDLGMLEGARVVARDEGTGRSSEGTPDAYGVVPLRATASWNPSKLRVDIRLRG